MPEMNVSFRFNAALRNGDEIRLMAPPGAGATCFFLMFFFHMSHLSCLTLARDNRFIQIWQSSNLDMFSNQNNFAVERVC